MYMKKFLSFILISFILFINLFVPISVLAIDDYSLQVSVSNVTDKTATISAEIIKNTSIVLAPQEYLTLNLIIKDEATNIVDVKKDNLLSTSLNKPHLYTFDKKLIPGGKYTVEANVEKIGKTGIPDEVAQWNKNTEFTMHYAVQKEVSTQKVNFCEILSAVWDPAGEQKDGFYKPGVTADIIIKTKNCIGAMAMNFSVLNFGGLFHKLSASGLIKKGFDISSDNFKFQIKLGEEACVRGVPGFNCNLYFTIQQNDVKLYDSDGKSGGNLKYDCDGVCMDNAGLINIVSVGSEDKPVGVDAQKDIIKDGSVYQMLAPIGGITCMDSSTNNADPKCIKNDIGKYLNIIFKLGIGLCAALAVIMLIINGITYMGDESIFKKTEAKSKMYSAIFGLLIALGAWALLNTINPDLTGKNGLFIGTVVTEIDDESDPWTQYQNSNGATVVGCDIGFIDVSSQGGPIHICKSIASNLEKMIIAAQKDNIILSGGGFRNRSSQLSLRIKNCQPPTRTPQALEFEKLTPPCNTATAIPGSSNHEKGLAIDFNCNGEKMKKTDQENICYKWLVKNAGDYGFKNNFAELKEVWHWSVDGK